MTNTTLTVITFETEPFVYRNRKGEYAGICVRILKQLSNDLGFHYVIRESEDEHFGVETDGEWSGLIGELIRPTGYADMAIQTISVTENRSRVVNFTAPFMMSGISAMMEATDTSRGEFLRSLSIIY